jgi:hypothetical protein
VSRRDRFVRLEKNRWRTRTLQILFRAIARCHRRMKFELPLQNKAFLHLLAGQNMAVPFNANVPSRFSWRREFARMRN